MVGAIDTQIMFEVYTGVINLGYKDLVHLYYPKSAYQYCYDETLSDWRLRPGQGMTVQQEQYAVNDVHALLRIFNILREIVSKI